LKGYLSRKKRRSSTKKKGRGFPVDENYPEDNKAESGKGASTKAKVKKSEQEYKKVKKTTPPGEGGRFEAMEKVAKAKGAKDPGALAAYIGRKKYGPKKFAAMAKKGKA
jgi:hypothetical protein